MSLQEQYDLLGIQVKNLEKKAALHPEDPDIQRTVEQRKKDAAAIRAILNPESVVEVPVVEEVAGTVDEPAETVVESTETVSETTETIEPTESSSRKSRRGN